jgi:uroporphyrinogen-III decarboxylase
MSTRQEKIDRVIKALNHEEPDRVPVGEFFWTNFIRRCKAELDVGDDFDPYRYWDLDMVVLTVNMDPKITGIEVLEDTPERKVVKTGFGATIERVSTLPMPHFADFDYASFEAVEALEFDDPYDPRRFFEPIDDQLNSVGDELNLNLRPWIERVNDYARDLCVFGATCEPHELVWRIMGSENVMIKMAEDPDRFARIIDRLGDFAAAIADAQIKAADGKLSGLYIWGDIAYVNGMMFSPRYWREVYQPQLKKITDVIHGHGLKAIYHSDGDLHLILDDLIEGGIDGLNPLEAKARMDVLEFKRTHGDRLCFDGNLNVQVLETNDRDQVRELVLTRLNAAKGGGYILQSDHSVPDNVAPATYDYVIQLAREYGRYPLNLGEYDRDVSPLPAAKTT